jgi:hypothetical protein
VALPASLHLFPVRHHSPRTSHVLRAFLDEVRPTTVLVEGPSDADLLLDVLLDRETTPPIAILGYRTDGTPASSLWPFASYSPEYVALAWAKANRADAHFVDITIGQTLAAERPADAEDHAAEAEPSGPSFYAELARSRGFRSFEEFWEASFEAPAYDAASFRAALLAYAECVRLVSDRPFHRARDAYMVSRIEAALAAGSSPERTVVVLGAAHAAAIAAGEVDRSLESLLAPTVPSASTIIPYSFPRLAEQTGYGAGNRAPQYYQRAFDAQGDFRRATLEVLVELSDHLRLRGFMASLADTIEAYRLACTLADLRGKQGPGLDEVREATIATMCRGDATHVDGFLWSTIVGRGVGKVASRIGKNSLQEEFWREVEHRRLPRTDAPESFVLKSNDPVQVATSTFLHRLRVAEIPYASYQGARQTRAAPAEEAGGLAALARVKEAWQAQWTPSTDVALVERIVLGDTLEQVCARSLGQKLQAATNTAAAAEVLLESVVTATLGTISAALAACDRFAATDDDLPSLARACRALSGLVSYGSARAASAIGDEAVSALCIKTFARAVLRVGSACVGGDDAIAPIAQALRILHEIALAQPLVDREAWMSVARELVDSYVVHPRCAGLAAGLLYLAQRIDEKGIGDIVAQRMSNTLALEQAVSFLEGFLQVNSLVLVKSRPIVEALDRWLVELERQRFRDQLPLLRRAFGALGQTERRYLLENLLALRKIGDKAAEAAQLLGEKDKEKLAAVSDDIKKAMDDLDDLL